MRTVFLIIILLIGISSVHAGALDQPQMNCQALLETVLDIKTDPTLKEKTPFNFKAAFSQVWGNVINGTFFDVFNRGNFDYLEKKAIDPTKPLPSVEQLKKVWKEVLEHPVAGLCHLKNYDPSGHIGFCFGRAMAAHLESMVQGIDEMYIKKVFIFGDFQSPVDGEDSWVYHVTTIVRANDGHWYAIDPRMDGPILLQQWAAHWASFSVERVKYLVTEPRRLFPQGSRYESYRHSYFKGPAKYSAGSMDTDVAAYLRALAESYYEVLARLPE